MKDRQDRGTVWLVGAGPGDAGLLTLRGLDCLRRADVVVFDRLVGPGVRSMIPPGVRKIDVGKSSGDHPVPQERIQEILLEEAQAGNCVVRLKGGDPFLFGRGGEEMAWLEERGVQCLMVPGVTSALAAPAYGGIPATHRDCSPAVHIITAHGRRGKDWSPDWRCLAAEEGTLVFLMGLSRLPDVARELIAAGKSPSTPAAVIQKGSTSRQKVLRAVLAEIPGRVEQEGIESPALTVIGPAAALTLDWTRRLPLFGRLIVVTRAREQAGVLSERLRRLGAEVVEFPAISTEPSFSDRRLERLDFSRYRWLAFTSPRGVEYAFHWLRENNRDVRELAGLKLAALGTGTAEALRNRGLMPDLIPEIFDGAHLGEALAKTVNPGQRVLMLRAEKANPDLPSALDRAGIAYDDIPVYRTNPASGDTELLRELLDRGEVDAVTFTSASTVDGFRHAAGEGRRNFLGLCIGPTSAAAAKAAGYQTSVASQATLDSLVEAVITALSHRPLSDRLRSGEVGKG